MAKIRLDFTQEEVEKALIDYWTEKHHMREKGSRFMRSMGDTFPNPKIEWAGAKQLDAHGILRSVDAIPNGCSLIIGTDEEPYKPYFEATDASD